MSMLCYIISPAWSWVILVGISHLSTHLWISFIVEFANQCHHDTQGSRTHHHRVLTSWPSEKRQEDSYCIFVNLYTLRQVTVLLVRSCIKTGKQMLLPSGRGGESATSLVALPAGLGKLKLPPGVPSSTSYPERKGRTRPCASDLPSRGRKKTDLIL